uniref:ATP synthase complex subunit 8 n=1 Tax=Engaeus lengana TaxID=552816 RepID=U5TX35_9EUCA|nr:ATP synthase F0 subunit 8 [Engaeus lengana]AGZ13061.1 ATP synthase F0 subunit 8 [Engaeus lengana]
MPQMSPLLWLSLFGLFLLGFLLFSTLNYFIPSQKKKETSTLPPKKTQKNWNW